MRHRGATLFSLRLLLHDKNRLLTSVGGVTFALLLMLMQLGFRNALLDSSLELLRKLDADVVVISEEKEPFLRRDEIPHDRLYQALGAEGVEAAYPIWLSLLYWRNLEDGSQRPIRVIGFDPRDPVFLIDEVNAAADELARPDTAIIDSRSRGEYGQITLGPAEVQGRRLEIVGTFPLGTDFEAGGNLIVGHETFVHLSPWRDEMRDIEMALVHLRPEADVEHVLSSLRAVLPDDVRVYTKAQLVERDLRYWRTGTPLSIVLLIGVGLGFAVGVVICYQILYTLVIDHVAEFATVKAMGYGDAYIRWVVLGQAWALSILGFLPGAALGALVLAVLAETTGLPARFNPTDLAAVFALSLGMCSLAGALALRQVAVLDPAELF